MIYLIDDNKKRQQDSGWNEDKFEEYNGFIHPIYRLSEITDELRNELFKCQNNVVLFHESFFENFDNKQVNDVNDIRNKLEELSNKTNNRYYVIFSGSNSERKINESNTSASIPVHILYINLEVFIKQYLHKNEYNLKYLLYGTNIDIEPLLLEELNKSKRLFIEESITITNELDDHFFFRSKLDFNPLNKNHTTIFNKDSEFGLHEKINESLSIKVYKGIFIPLCFGNSLSDFNGLRLATEIRSSNTINQFTPIFIYNFVRIEYLLQNEYFNILKTKGVELVDYSKKAFHNVTSLSPTPITPFELPYEIRKLELQPPKNYLDNHSIANEWAIMRWFKTLHNSGVLDYIPDEIESIETNITSNLYYKYLTCKFPIDKTNTLEKKDLKLKQTGNILYIDDESYKGWNNLFCALFWKGEINKVENFATIGSELNGLDKEGIIHLCVEKAKDFDLIILDFRLHNNDFYETDPKQITGYKILEKIKEYNQGIQVIIFSASNKIWNLQALQNAGADGFIVKESPENSLESDFTVQSIKNTISNIDKCLAHKFKKELLNDSQNIAKILNLQSYDENIEYNKFINALKKQLKIIDISIVNADLKRSVTLDLVFLSCFNFLELFKGYYIKFESDQSYYLGIDQTELNRYYVLKGELFTDGKFVPKDSWDTPSWFCSISALLIDYFKIATEPGFKEIYCLDRVAKKRNNYIHSDKNSFDINEVKMIFNLLMISCKNIRE
jgi:CheY-like chemotaxis protein